jgi:hypothetical protein
LDDLGGLDDDLSAPATRNVSQTYHHGQTIKIEPKCVTGILGVSLWKKVYQNYYSPSPSGGRPWAVWTVWTMTFEGYLNFSK